MPIIATIIRYKGWPCQSVRIVKSVCCWVYILVPVQGVDDYAKGNDPGYSGIMVGGGGSVCVVSAFGGTAFVAVCFVPTDDDRRSGILLGD